MKAPTEPFLFLGCNGARPFVRIPTHLGLHSSRHFAPNQPQIYESRLRKNIRVPTVTAVNTTHRQSQIRRDRQQQLRSRRCARILACCEGLAYVLHDQLDRLWAGAD